MREEPSATVMVALADAIVRGLSFSKSMRWDDSGIRFPRPVRWTLAKLGSETVVGTTTFGHRFTAGAVEIPDAGAYEERLREAGVEPVAEERRRRIVAGLDEIGGWGPHLKVLAPFPRPR